MNRSILALALLGLSGCVTASPQQKASGCEAKDIGYLKGLKMGANMNQPDASTEKGQSILAQIAELEVRCGLKK